VALFKDIIRDLFPGRELKQGVFEKLDRGLKEVAEEMKYVLEENFYEKVIQLYETSRVRHGLMVVGEPLSGKTGIIEIL